MTNQAMERYAEAMSKKDAQIAELKAALSGRTVSCVCGGNAALIAALKAQVKIDLAQEVERLMWEASSRRAKGESFCGFEAYLEARAAKLRQEAA